MRVFQGTARNPERVVNIRELVARDRRMTLTFSDVQLHNKRQEICQNLQEDLGKRKIFKKYIPYNFMDQQTSTEFTRALPSVHQDIKTNEQKRMD